MDPPLAGALLASFEDEIVKLAKENLPWAVIVGILIVLGIFFLLARAGDAAQGVEKLVRVVQGIPWFNPKRKERAERRQQLAQTLVDRLDKLRAQEQWAGHGYTDLEVEVVPSVRRRSRLSGLLPERAERRRASLGREIGKSAERRVLLKGDPGAGKSMALRHVAEQLARHAAKARGATAVIPIYVNLKGFEAKDGVPDLQELEDFVRKSLNPHDSTVIGELLGEDEFAIGRRQGTWLFLLDSFDELPDVLGATEEDRTIEAYSAVINEFAAGHKSRVVVASRFFRAPEGLQNWATLEIAPLTEARRQRFIGAADLTDEDAKWLIDRLAVAHVDVVALASNPLFLTLLCQHARHERSLPDFPYGIFKAEIARRLNSEQVRKDLRQHFRLTSEELEENAGLVAYTMSAEKLGLEPRRPVLADEASRACALPAATVEATLVALEHINLARGESDEQRNDADRRFTFSHRRFQEYFATRVVLQRRSRISVEDLITDDQWRETAVTLCQNDEDVDEIVTAITEHLDAAAAELAERDAPGGVRDFVWPSRARHVLGILQSGFGAVPARLPDATRETVARIADHVWAHAEQDDHALMFEFVGVAPEEARTRLLSEAFRSGSTVLGEVCYRQVARLAHVPPGLAEEMRRALVGMAASGRLLEERRSIKAQISRLEGGHALEQSLAILLKVRRIDALVHVLLAGAAVACAILLDEVALALVSLPWLAVSYVTWPGVARAMASARIDLGRLTRAAWGWVSPTVLAVMVRAYVGFTAWIFLADVTDAAGLIGVAAAYVVLWPIAVPAAVVRGEFLKTALVPLAPLIVVTAARSAMTAKRVLVVTLVVGFYVVAIVGLSSLFEEVDPGALPTELFVALYGLFGVWVLYAFFSTVGHDWFWYLVRWHRPAPGALLPRELLLSLGRQKTTAGLHRVIKVVSRENLLDTKDESAAPILRDLLRATRSKSSEKVKPAELEWLTDDVRSWMIDGGEDRLSLFVRSGPKLRDAIDPILKEVRREAERRRAATPVG